MKKIALLSGGMGAEREVSLATGKAFAKALDDLKLNYVNIIAGPDLPEQLIANMPDVALLALHGKYAEDGTVQGLCEYLKIPYSGSGVMSSALCMNKYYCKQILQFHDLPTPKFQIFYSKTDLVEVFPLKISFPLVTKPSREGSTVGISIVKSSAEFAAAIELAGQYDNEILIEEYIPGAELTCAVFDGKALTPIEIVPKSGYYDYKNKYTAGQTEYILPPRLPNPAIESIKKLAHRAHQALQCRVYSRIDFRVNPAGDPFILEINTLPGCTQTSLLPKAAAHDGLSFTQLIKTLVDKASLDYEGVR